MGFGLKFRHDGWDFFSQYTWWRSERRESKSRVTASDDFQNEVISNIFFPNGNNGMLETFRSNHARASWKMQFNALDLELGRNFWISKFLTLRPFVGMKFSWIEQSFRHKHRNIFSQGNTLAAVPVFALETDNTFSSHNKMDQFGVGMRSGLNTACTCGKSGLFMATLLLANVEWFRRFSQRLHHSSRAC